MSYLDNTMVTDHVIAGDAGMTEAYAGLKVMLIDDSKTIRRTA